MDDKKEKIFSMLVITIESFLQVARQKEEKPVIKHTTDLHKDLGLDSLEAMDLVAEIEKTFEISVNAQELIARTKIDDMVDYIANVKKTEKV